MLASFLTTLLFSISAVTATRSVRILGSNAANLARLAIATAVLGAWAHICGGGLQGPALTVFILSGCIGFGIGDAALYAALPRIGSRLTVMLVQCLAAPLAAITEWLWLGTTLTLQQTTCSALILAGVAVALAPRSNETLSRRSAVVVGTLFGVLAAGGQAIGAVLSRKAYNLLEAAGENIDGMTAAYQRILGGVVIAALILTFSAKRSPRALEPALESSEAVALAPRRGGTARSASIYVLINAVAGPVAGVSCFQWALQTTPSGIVLPIVATTPLVIMPLARYMEGERIGLRSLTGGLLAVIGAVALALGH